jgi:predicted dehydrogenase
MNEPRMLLVGAGAMARAYLAVLTAMDIPTIVVGRSAASAEALSRDTGTPVAIGGIARWLAEASRVPERAIVAVSVDSLASTTRSLIRAGVRSILVEKPAALALGEIDQLTTQAKRQGADVYVAYNRRFLHSTRTARKVIAEDGGVTSMTFEFTELAQRVGASSHPPEVKRAWLLANSSHVIDLAFHLAGHPEQIASLSEGSLDWHPTGSRFVGVGRTSNGALFSYHADWESPGRWGIHVHTRRHMLRMQPLERLTLQEHGSFDSKDLVLPSDDPDCSFKPGLYRQVEAFTQDPVASALPSLPEHRGFVADVITPIADGDRGVRSS